VSYSVLTCANTLCQVQRSNWPIVQALCTTVMIRCDHSTTLAMLRLHRWPSIGYQATRSWIAKYTLCVILYKLTSVLGKRCLHTAIRSTILPPSYILLIMSYHTCTIIIYVHTPHITRFTLIGVTILRTRVVAITFTKV
jgi:hypothetical protein